MPMEHVINALNAKSVHKPLITVFSNISSQSNLNGVAIKSNVTIGLNLMLRSCRVNSHNNVAVVKCWI